MRFRTLFSSLAAALTCTSSLCFSQNIFHGGNADGFALNSFAQADNPLTNIYSGGNADGFSLNSFTQADNPLTNIYSGGNADGFSLNSFAQADNVLFDIYKGGIEDGFAMANFAQASNVLYDIYKGGNEDGFALSSFAQPDNALYDIYKGGIMDGFALASFAQPDNPAYDIYKGGVADGFALASLGSMGGEVPLPITLISFTARFEGYQVLIQWKTASEVNNDYFLLERSRDSETFLQLYKVAGAGTTAAAHSYVYADESPFEGLNYYRLKQTDFNGVSTYSRILSVFADKLDKPSLRLFPNPSSHSNTVQLQLTSVGSGLPVELSITNAMGEKVGTFSGATDAEGVVVIPSSLTTSLSGGVYVINVKSGAGNFTAKWVVK